MRYDLSYDDWLPDAERTYQVQSERVATEEPPTFTQKTFYPVAAGLKRDFPEVEAATALWDTRPVVLQNGQSTYADMVMADEHFFDVLDLPLVRGDRRTALASMDSLVLTESEARKYFGNDDPMGRTLTVIRRGVPADLRVTGILRDLPANSHWIWQWSAASRALCSPTSLRRWCAATASRPMPMCASAGRGPGRRSTRGSRPGRSGPSRSTRPAPAR